MTSPLLNRREMLQTSAIAAGVMTMNITKANAFSSEIKTELKKEMQFLFQGDSITDARRNKNMEVHPNNTQGLGDGYPFLIAGELLLEHPELNLKIYNRGISGNKVPDLQNRWKKDCLEIKPAVLSILIGVNDMWHKVNGKYDGTVEDYKNGFYIAIETNETGTAGDNHCNL